MFTNEAIGEKRFYQPHRLLSGRFFLTFWAAISLLWAAGVAFDLYHKAATQADMSRDVERELDQSLIPASCIGVQCGGTPQPTDNTAQNVENWSDIASTYLKFGRNKVLEFVFGPPIAMLFLGLAGLVFYRHRLTNNRSQLYSRSE